MTLDEARMILNVRPQDSMDILAQVRHSMPFSSILFSTAVQYLQALTRLSMLVIPAGFATSLCLSEALVLTTTPSVLTSIPFRDSTSS